MTRILGWVAYAALWPIVTVLGVLDNIALALDEDDPWDVLSD